VLLQDIHKTEISGWEYFEKFEAKKGKCRIFILSSSVDSRDKEKADNTRVLKVFFKTDNNRIHKSDL